MVLQNDTSCNVTTHASELGNWKQELQQSFRTALELLEAGYINADEYLTLKPVIARYQFLLPRYYASLIDRSDPKCPIRAQAIPSVNELSDSLKWLKDPLEDLNHKPLSRITHRYQGRVLLHLSPNCSMYCRFCFRKTLLNEMKADLFEGSITEGISYIQDTTSINEVILSGGDPLLMGTEALGTLIDMLDNISHIRRIRIHSRVPVTLPSRIDHALTSKLGNTKKHLVIVTHFNHPKEITSLSQYAASSLKAIGITLLNQSVLLSGVNDDVQTLIELSERLFDTGILPYYLHHPDKAQGTEYFSLSKEQGLKIYHEVRKNLSGYLVPRYVTDVVCKPYKVEVSSTP